MKQGPDQPGDYRVVLPIVEKSTGPEPEPTATPAPTATATPPPGATATPTPTPTDGPPPTSQRLAIDPITRIEGHLRIEVQIEDGYVVDAWSAGMMFRGIELILPGRDPREAWIYTQRICGVCTDVHAISSIRAVEHALGITIPDNARLVRNLIHAAQFVQDHVIHFYHLHALDWVDVVSALSADPAATSALAQSISPWPKNSAAYFQTVRDRLEAFVSSGQLGPFANGYWGHPEYKLPPEGNLLAVAHYLEALEWQREFIKLHALLGGKNPHPQSYLVGGVSIPVDALQTDAINPQRIADLRALVNGALEFVQQVYLPDLMLVASFYPEWTTLGEGVGDYLAYGDFPEDNSGSVAAFLLPRGIVLNRDLSSPPLPLDQDQIREYVTHSWYGYPEGDASPRHPSNGETNWQYTGPQPPFDLLDTNGKYSWLKAPRYDDMAMEVGPLARMAVAYAGGHARVRQLTDQVLAALQIGHDALFSTLGRVAARGIETLVIAERLGPWIDALEANMSAGELAIHNTALWDPATWPAQAAGWGLCEAPRGALGHWVRIENQAIANYQCVVPSTWNGSPRDALGQRGPWEEALVGTPVADPAQPVEILRTIHSFDPCMACAVHVLDATGREVTSIRII